MILLCGLRRLVASNKIAILQRVPQIPNVDFDFLAALPGVDHLLPRPRIAVGTPVTPIAGSERHLSRKTGFLSSNSSRLSNYTSALHRSLSALRLQHIQLNPTDNPPLLANSIRDVVKKSPYMDDVSANPPKASLAIPS